MSRCAICGDTDGLLVLVRLDCVCGGDHLTCSECRWVWRAESHLGACPETDEFKVAAELMGGR